MIYPPSTRWAIYGDRNMEIGIVAAMDEETAIRIDSTKLSLKFFTPLEAVTELLPSVYRGNVPDAVSRSLIAHYALTT